MKKANLKSAKVPYMKSTPKAGAKREVEEKEVVVVAVPAAVSKDGKKRTKSETVASEEKQQLEDSKKQGQRLFSEESEIELLKGMVDFADKTRKNFKDDLDGFYEYVKKELDVAFSKSQLLTKVKNLKRKYTKNVEKVKKGEELKPLDKKLYDLSGKIWGGGGAVKSVSNRGIDVAGKSNGKRKRVRKEHIFKNEEEMCDATTKEAEVDSLSLIELMKSSAGYVLNEELIKRGWNSISKDKRMKMNEQWESLLLDEVKLNLRRLELARLHGQLVLDAFGASSH
uniref:Glabrous enhancer-binding protein-like DBD domain-containing protein n=1 Tax=Kalanchoe fedtschenkoi TaxID=63787 RepID=A0A7N0UJJ3_KALFE